MPGEQSSTIARTTSVANYCGLSYAWKPNVTLGIEFRIE